jgi:hypothetical protein
LYFKGKWRGAGQKGPLIGHFDSFQMHPNKSSNETGRFSPVSLAASLTQVPGAADKFLLL